MPANTLLILSSLLIILLSHPLKSQTETKRDSSNWAIYGTIGGPLLFNIGISAETSLSSRWRYKTSLISLQGAYYASDEDPAGALALAGDFAYLTATRGSCLELSFGLGASVKQYSDRFKFPIVFIKSYVGYRYEGKTIFRIGTGFPEMLGVSLGFKL